MESKTFGLRRTEEGNHGLLAFKNHWTPAPDSLIYWSFSPGRSVNSIRKWNQPMVKRFYTLVPDRLLQAVGTMIYRRAG